MGTKAIKCISRCWRKVVGLIVPFALSPLLFIVNTKEARCAYVILWLAIYFIIEPIPIPVTSLLPILLYPFLGILSTDETCMLYFKDIIVMCLGALIIALAVEHCNLHKRIALKVLLTLGTSVRWLMIGFLTVSSFLSMWLINTAITAMMTPIVDALILELKNDQNEILISNQEECETLSMGEDMPNGNIKKRLESKQEFYEKLRKALMLSVAYSSTCGGTGSVLGTAPNLLLLGLLERLYPKTNQLTFTTWLMYNVPGMILCVIAIFVVLQYFYIGFGYRSDKNEEKRIKSVLERKYSELGSIKFQEFGVLIVFFLLVLVWLFSKSTFIEGWISRLNSDVAITNASPGIAALLLLFILPANPRNFFKSKPLIDWKTTEKKLPWGILLLFGSSLAVPEGAEKSGLSFWVAEHLKFLNALSPNTVLFILCIMTATVTEFLTNMTTSTLLLPVVHQIAIAVGVNPLFFMLPVTICCSFSFMLPVGNPPCAIVYHVGNMKTLDLVKPGIFLNVICCGIEILMINTLGNVVFDFSISNQNLNTTFTSNNFNNNSM